MKVVQIRSYFWFVFSCIRTEYGDLRSVFSCIRTEYSVNFHIQSEYRKIRTRNNSVFKHFSRSGYLTAVYYKLFLKFKINSVIIFALKTLFPKFLHQVSFISFSVDYVIKNPITENALDILL